MKTIWKSDYDARVQEPNVVTECVIICSPAEYLVLNKALSLYHANKAETLLVRAMVEKMKKPVEMDGGEE